MTKILRISC